MSSDSPTLSVLVVGNYLPDGQRSMQRFAELLTKGLSERNITVRLWYPPVIIGVLGAKGHGLGKWIGYIDKYILAPILLKRAVSRCDSQTVVHICDHSNAIYTKVLKRQAHIVTCHDLLAVRSALGEIPQNPLSKSGKQQQAMILRGLKDSQCIASVSNATKEDVIRIVGSKPEWSHVIENALDDAFINAAETDRITLQQTHPCPLQTSSDQELFVHIGGEKWYKNRSAVLRLFAKLRERRPQAQLAIVGNEFSAEQLEANGCGGYEKHIHYLHGISDESLRGLYAHATALLFPSWIEGFGWPILEAQACGCPVVTLDCQPMNELNAINGLCLPVDCDAADWADRSVEQIEETLSGTEKPLDNTSLQEFSARFTNQVAISKYEALYHAILERELVK